MKKILSLLMLCILVCGACVCFSSCNKEDNGSSADEASNTSGNIVFTDEYFKDAVRISMTLYSGEYDGEKMNAVIDVLKNVSLEASDRSIYPWKNASGDEAEELRNKIWTPFSCIVYYSDGSNSNFVFTDCFVTFEDDATETNYRVSTGDLCRRIMDALGIEGID